VNDIDPAFAAELELLSPRVPVAPDWSDVLARAGVRRPTRTPRAIVLAAASLVLVVLAATPALGLLSRERPALRFGADLHAVAGSGTGTFRATPLRTFRHPGSNRVFFPPAFSSTLTFGGLSGPATSARLRIAARRGGRPAVVQLCAPCRSGTTLVVRRRGLLLVAIDGRATIEVATAAHPAGELRGNVVRLR
jgi:hypothetical protein